MSNSRRTRKRWRSGSVGTVIAVAALVAGLVSGSPPVEAKGLFDLSDQTVEERLRMHRGSLWRVKDETPNSTLRSPEINALYEKYFSGEEISLGANRMMAGEGLLDVTLLVVRNGLMCVPTGKGFSHSSLCGDDVGLEEIPTAPGPLGNCIRQALARETNLVGVFQETTVGAGGQNIVTSYCLHIVLAETKKQDAAGKWKSSASRIVADKIFPFILKETSGGNAGPGTLVGGPRQQN